MRRRIWAWAGGLGLCGLLDLLLAVRSRVDWRSSASGPEDLTLDQLLGFLTGAVLLVVATAIALVCVRNLRRRRRLARALGQGRVRGRRRSHPGS